MHNSPVLGTAADSASLRLSGNACRRLLGHGAELTDTVVGRIRAEVPYYADPVLAPPDVRTTVDTGVRHGLEAGVDPDRIVDVER